MESGVRCQIEVAQADSSACIGSCGCSGFPLAAVDAVAALAAVDAVVALAAVEAHPYRDGFVDGSESGGSGGCAGRCICRSRGLSFRALGF